MLWVSSFYPGPPLNQQTTVYKYLWREMITSGAVQRGALEKWFNPPLVQREYNLNKITHPSKKILSRNGPFHKFWLPTLEFPHSNNGEEKALICCDNLSEFTSGRDMSEHHLAFWSRSPPIPEWMRYWWIIPILLHNRSVPETEWVRNSDIPETEWNGNMICKSFRISRSEWMRY